MTYNIYDMIAELIQEKADISIEDAQKEARELSTFIQECLNNIEAEVENDETDETSEY